MKYAYQRDGQPIVYWGTSLSAPHQSRAADAAALGSLGGSTLGDTVLPAPGAPEPILSGVGGCSCRGSCGCGTGLSGIAESVPGGYFTLAVAGFLAWKFLVRKGK